MSTSSPGLFPQKMGGSPHPFFEGKALGTRLQQCCKKGCTFFVACFTVPLQWRIETFKLKRGPPGYPDPEISGGGGGGLEGLKKIFSLV